MKNKKRKLIIFSTFIMIVIGIYLLIPKTKEDAIDNINNKEKVNANGFLTLMLEQDDGSYQESSSSSWPGDGYAFNSELSGCERGGELVFDRENNIVKLISNGSDKCYVYFDKYNNPTVNSVSVTDTTTSSISISVSASGGTNNVATYYYSINNGAYTSSSNNTYTFSGLSKGTTYSIKVYVKDSNEVDSAVKTISAQTESLTYICTTETNLATCIKNQYTSQGTNGVYYHTSSLANSAADNSYRYAGANPNNYVCFGTDASTCPSDNLYRIIGVFGSEVKLIKSTSYGSYAWDSSGSNTWSTSSIRSKLNTTYLSSLSSTWQNKIATHTWKTEKINVIPTNIAKEFYNAEEGSGSSSTTDSIKIGLMYISDYGFAASNNYWATNLSSYNSATDSNWLYLGLTEWTITSSREYWDYAFFIISGYLYSNQVTRVYEVRPSFYLTSSTTYVYGSGTSADPIRIN